MVLCNFSIWLCAIWLQFSDLVLLVLATIPRFGFGHDFPNIFGFGFVRFGLDFPFWVWPRFFDLILCDLAMIFGFGFVGFGPISRLCFGPDFPS